MARKEGEKVRRKETRDKEGKERIKEREQRSKKEGK